MDEDLDYNQRKLVGEVLDSAFTNVTDSIIDTHSAVVVLAITITLEISGLLMFFVAHDKVMAALERIRCRYMGLYFNRHVLGRLPERFCCLLPHSK